MKEPKRPWTDAELVTAKTMHAGGATARQIASKLGRSIGAVNSKLDRVGRDRGVSDPEPTHRVDETHGDQRSVVWTTSTPVRTQADALAKAEVDENVWRVDRMKINSWEQASKNDEGEVVKTPLWQVDLRLVRKAGWSPKEFLAEVVAALRTPTRAKGKAKPRGSAKGVLAELSIADHHFGKLAWAPEVGENYDLKIAEDRYAKASRLLLRGVADRKPDRIAIVVGNDFYHVDRGDNMTTRGTPQDADGRWQKAFVGGARQARNSIDEAAELAPVDVLVVSGNHDEERAFLLGVLLAAVYENNPRVTVHNEPSLYKRFRWGTTLLGFFHGHNMPARRFQQLPNEMAHHWPNDWAETTWREWHFGHLHSESEDVWRYRASETIGDVVVRRLPSLCGTDRWHHANGYRSLGAAEAHYYSAETGRMGYDTVTQLALEQN